MKKKQQKRTEKIIYYHRFQKIKGKICDFLRELTQLVCYTYWSKKDN